jgi:thioredoxin-related protein
MIRLILFSTIFLLGLSSTAFTQTKEYMPVSKFDPLRDAVKDINEAIEEAKKSNRRILLDVGGEWCIWCHRLDDFIESNREIKSYLHKNYVVVKINFSKENKNEEVLSKYPEIPGYPHFFVLEKTGKFLHSQGTGELEQDKSYSSEKIMGFLKKWAP